MIRILAYLSLFTFLAINTYFLVIASDDIERADVSHRLSYLENDYHENIYECFFALEETRPYAIIQVDKLIQMYNNSWTEPDKISEMLTKNEKQVLMKKVAEFIEDKDEVDQSILLNKITNWCRVRKFFSLVDHDYGFTKSDLVSSTSKFDATAYIVQGLSMETAQADMSISSLSPLATNEAYYKTINHIAGLKIKTQFDLFSNIFEDLAKQSE